MDKFQAAENILNFIKEEAITQFPIFPEAFGLLHFHSSPLKTAALCTDGETLFYDAQQVYTLFQQDSSLLRWMYLHTHLHAIMGHCTIENEHTDDSFCDKEVAYLAYLLTNDSNIVMNRFKPPSSILNFFKNNELNQCNSIFFADSHEKWFSHKSSEIKNISSESKVTGSKHTSLLHSNPFWSKDIIKEKVLTAAKENESNRNGKRGSSSGRFEEDADLQKRDALDYTKFLRRFTISREEAILDTDSFDYIPYHYGLTYYENLPFIEPLEYKEVNRLDELAIAIDTSGSCSGVIVRRFLEETWNILSQRENFFSKMRLHLIQCDCMVQEHRIFTSVEEWEEAVPNLQIHGHGDTDFQPVFTYLEKLIARGEIRQLRGLLFFTDGDGIFPPTAPSFDTAFIFLNHETEKHAIPDWGIRLNLNLTNVFEN